MKRIALYIDTQYESGGTYQYTKSLINALNSLSKENFLLTFLYTYENWVSYLENFKNADSIHLKKSHAINKLYKLSFILGLYKIVKYLSARFDREIRHIDKQNFDFVIFPAGDTIASLVNSNVISAIHDLMHRYQRRFKESGNIFKYRFREVFYRHLLISSKAILVDSKLGERQLRESYETIIAKIFILPYIAPDYLYKKPEINDFEFKNPYDTGNYIFYPAQFWPHKNHINLLKAIKILKSRGLKLDLILSGNKDREYKRIKRYVDNTGLNSNIIFLGYIPDNKLVKLYSNALALVMPTFFGPTNIPPIEAIILGCPPIVSGIYGMPEQFEDAALYFNPEDPFDIADKIELLAKNNKIREDLINKGWKLRPKFSQERFSNDISKILAELEGNS